MNKGKADFLHQTPIPIYHPICWVVVIFPSLQKFMKLLLRDISTKLQNTCVQNAGIIPSFFQRHLRTTEAATDWPFSFSNLAEEAWKRPLTIWHLDFKVYHEDGSGRIVHRRVCGGVGMEFQTTINNWFIHRVVCVQDQRVIFVNWYSFVHFFFVFCLLLLCVLCKMM